MRLLSLNLFFCFVIAISGCNSEGYSCNSEGCYEDNNNPQYQALEDCNSLCESNTTTPGNCGTVNHAGHTYSTVVIGEQCWFAENCLYLPEVSPSNDGFNGNAEPYYYVYDYQGSNVYDAKATSNYNTYGVLYNWHAVMGSSVCPSGWHIPTVEEWTELTDELGGVLVAGDAMKSNNGWNSFGSSDAGNGSNSSGFNGLPGGNRDSGGSFFDIESYGGWWASSTPFNNSDITRYYLELKYFDDRVNHTFCNASFGRSARCVKD